MKNDEVWNSLINEVDVNGDGTVDFEEFKRMFQDLMNNQASKLITQV